MELGVLCPVEFFFSQLDEIFQSFLIALLQQPVSHHRTECGCEGHGDFKRDTVGNQVVKYCKKRQIALGHRLIKPVLLQHVVAFRMPYIGKMGMKHKTQVTFCSVMAVHVDSKPVTQKEDDPR